MNLLKNLISINLALYTFHYLIWLMLLSDILIFKQSGEFFHQQQKIILV